MELVLEEILQEIQSICDIDTYNHLNNFITVKLNGYKLIKEETKLIKYETESEKWFKKFLVSKKLQGLSERTLKAYKYEITRFLLSINMPLRDITTDNVRYYLACYQLTGRATPVTIDNIRRYLNTFFQWLEDEDYIIKNPLKKIKKIRIKKEAKKAFSFDEIEKIKLSCEKIKSYYDRKRQLAIIETLLSTGCRAAELVNIKLNDINFNTGEVKVLGKGNKVRTTFLNSAAAARIKDYLDNRKGDSQYLFCSLQSPYLQLKESGLEITIRRLKKLSGIDNIHPHRFRRTCATIASKRGMRIEEIQKMLGHEDLNTTQIYVEVDAEDIKKSHEKYMN